jgi:hypothetical protein
MAVKLDQRAFDHAQDVIVAGGYVLDDRDAWSEHRPATRRENDFIAQHGIREYATWHLGIDDEEDEDNKGRYKFPYGDFTKSRAGQRKYYDIELAVAHLHERGVRGATRDS